MQKIVTHLWYDGQAEQAAKLYTSIFKNSKVGPIMRAGKAVSEVSGTPEGAVLTIEFELNGQTFYALNGGPMFKFNESVSLVVNCEDQAEVDYYWNKLLEGGGKPSACGWLKDRFGLSWQVVPKALMELTQGKDAAAIERVMKAMLKMVKLDVAELERAAKG